MVGEILTPCQCKLPEKGNATYCDRHKCRKTRSLVRLCQTDYGYFNQWENGRGPGQVDENIPQASKQKHEGKPPEGQGPGTELKKLIGRFGITDKPGCKCNARARRMDMEGPDWCEQNLETIVDWLKEEASKRKLPFIRTAGRVLVKRAISNARRHSRVCVANPKQVIPKVKPMGKPPKRKGGLQWAYGVTTVLQKDCLRIDELLPRTLESLEKAGFAHPRIFADGAPDPSPYAHFGLPITTRYPTISIVGNWILAAWELFIRSPQSDYYAIFQDDIVLCRNVRQYLERMPYPGKGYLNLYTFPVNQKLFKEGQGGFVLSNQLGRGAVALVFNRDSLITLLGHEHMARKNLSVRGQKSIDGAVVTATKKAGGKEYVHNPSLVQHTGKKSSLGNHKQPDAISFPGEDFDALELLK